MCSAGGLDELSGRMSSMSGKSNFSKYSATSNHTSASLNGGEDDAVIQESPPTSRREVFQFGQVCLIEAISWMQQALHIFDSSEDLRREKEMKEYLSNFCNK